MDVFEYYITYQKAHNSKYRLAIPYFIDIFYFI
jgi:hypothetical protein